jgi:hypothetical protein
LCFRCVQFRSITQSHIHTRSNNQHRHWRWELQLGRLGQLPGLSINRIRRYRVEVLIANHQKRTARRDGEITRSCEPVGVMCCVRFRQTAPERRGQVATTTSVACSSSQSIDDYRSLLVSHRRSRLPFLLSFRWLHTSARQSLGRWQRSRLSHAHGSNRTETCPANKTRREARCDRMHTYFICVCLSASQDWIRLKYFNTEDLRLYVVGICSSVWS